MKPGERLDLLIFGATGFTGLNCIPYAHKLTKDGGKNLTWGVAGRSELKLKEALSKMGKKINVDLSHIPIVVADIKSDDSLLQMAKSTKVIVNCCGPFRLMGEPVVKACVEAGTHYVDVTGEISFVYDLERKYHDLAMEKGIYIINACGMDSIPCDLGVLHLEEQFNGTVNSVVSYLEFWEEGDEPSAGPKVNQGTWGSVVHSFANTYEEFEKKKKYISNIPVTLKPKLTVRQIPYCPNVTKGWALPFLGADGPITKRTQRYFFEKENKRPIQIETKYVAKTFMDMVSLILFAALLFIMTKFECGTNLLLRYPHIFSLGIFSKENPSEETIERSYFQITFYGEGWKEKIVDSNHQFDTPPNKSIITRIRGKNPGYGATCILLLLSAIVILTEKDKLPAKGGVYTPGSALRYTSFLKRAEANGLAFEVVSQKDI